MQRRKFITFLGGAEGSTKIDKPAQRRYGVTTKLLSYFSAAWCGLSLLAIGIFCTGSAGKALRLPTVYQWPETAEQIYMALNSPDFYGILGGAGIASLFVLGLGVAIGRFLLRALPPMIWDQGRRGWFWPVVFYIAFIGVYICGVLLFLAMDTDTLPAAFKMDPKTLLLGVPYVISWTVGVIGLLIHRHHRPRAFLERPFVLFLRRFSTFSDRAVIALILQQAANKVPVVFLTPTISQPRDWDPYLVGFAGLKLWHPWRSTPIVTRAQDAAWQRAADELIRRAQTILLDISDTSSALRTEAEMLDRTDRWPDTVCLRLLVPNASLGKNPVGGFDGVRTIDYEKSWVRALPRMVIGFLIVLFAALSFLLIVGSMSPIIASAATAIIAPAYYYAVFVRPSINREAKLTLRTLFREVHAASAEAPQGINGWLILPIIGLITIPIRASYLLLTQYWPAFWDGTWEKFTTPGTAEYHHLWEPLITFEIISILVIVVLAVATLVLLFQKSKKTPAFAIVWAGTGALMMVFDDFFGGLIPAAAQQYNLYYDTAATAAIVGAAIWILYFLFSQRVKATFVR
jgi:hypothetical protein